MVSISESYMTLLQDYSDKTGVPIDRCVSDALFDWLGNVAPITLEQLGLEPLTIRARRPGSQPSDAQKRR
jgi:hypothetical protein